MADNPDLPENKSTARLRAEQYQKRKRLNRFFAGNRLVQPTKTKLVLYTAFWLSGMGFLLWETKMFSTPLSTSYFFYYLFILSSSVVITRHLIVYFKSRMAK